MGDASAALINLRPVTFHYRSDRYSPDRARQYGLIAEEVAEVYPDLVAHAADGRIESVMYQFLPTMLLNEFSGSSARSRPRRCSWRNREMC